MAASDTKSLIEDMKKIEEKIPEMQSNLKSIQSNLDICKTIKTEADKAMNDLKILRGEIEENNFKIPKFVRISLRDRKFTTSAKTLCGENSGGMFAKELLNKIQEIDEKNGKEHKSDMKFSELSKLKLPEDIVLEFDRDPKNFDIILDHLRMDKITFRLENLSKQDLVILLNNAKFFKLPKMEDMLMNMFNKQFNYYDVCRCSDEFNFSNVNKCATKLRQYDLFYYSIMLNGTLLEGRRFVELICFKNKFKRICIGVCQADCFSYTGIPGYNAGFKGVCYSAHGLLCVNTKSDKFGDAIEEGATFGMQVDIKNGFGNICFFINGKLQGYKIPLNDYIDVAKGIKFVVSLADKGDQVIIK